MAPAKAGQKRKRSGAAASGAAATKKLVAQVARAIKPRTSFYRVSQSGGWRNDGTFNGAQFDVSHRCAYLKLNELLFSQQDDFDRGYFLEQIQARLRVFNAHNVFGTDQRGDNVWGNIYLELFMVDRDPAKASLTYGSASTMVLDTGMLDYFYEFGADSHAKMSILKPGVTRLYSKQIRLPDCESIYTHSSAAPNSLNTDITQAVTKHRIIDVNCKIAVNKAIRRAQEQFTSAGAANVAGAPKKDLYLIVRNNTLVTNTQALTTHEGTPITTYTAGSPYIEWRVDLKVGELD